MSKKILIGTLLLFFVINIFGQKTKLSLDETYKLIEGYWYNNNKKYPLIYYFNITEGNYKGIIFEKVRNYDPVKFKLIKGKNTEIRYYPLLMSSYTHKIKKINNKKIKIKMGLFRTKILYKMDKDEAIKKIKALHSSP